MFQSTILAIATIFVAFVPAVVAQGTYTQIDEPNAPSVTYCYGVDDQGDIVGSYIDSTFNAHGFLLSGGTFTTIDYPGIDNSELHGINSLGQIVGFSAFPLPVVGFLYNPSTQSFTTLSYPGATATYPYRINDAGVVAGYRTSATGALSGFALKKSTYRAIKPPKASNSYAFGISKNGRIAGYVPNTNKYT